MKIAFCTSEAVPFAKTGGLADVCAALPLALARQGQSVCLVMPEYSSAARGDTPMEKIDDHISRSYLREDIPVFFIRNDSYFHRPGLYGDGSGDYQDNLLRFSFFCEQALQGLKKLSWQTDIIHCHDWQTSLIPVLLRHRFKQQPFFEKIKTVLTIHNLAYQGQAPAEAYNRLGLDPELFHEDLFEFYGQINLLKAGILTSDRITTVSPRYAREIQTAEFGCGLEGVLARRRGDMTGILNGIDTRVWDPETDPHLAEPYSAADPDGKRADKALLQKEAGLPVNPDIPVLGFIGRLSYQKGIDLLAEVVPRVLEEDLQMIILGDGEHKYEEILRRATAAHPDRVKTFFEFNDKRAHRIYAGSDILLMPSRYEPCGLNQMIALRYGVIPLVFRTGGLADTITPFEDGGNGFVFDSFSADDFEGAIRRAVRTYRDRPRFEQLRRRALDHDFSWDNAAQAYRNLYHRMLGR